MLNSVPEIFIALEPRRVPVIPATLGAGQVYRVVVGTTLPAIPFTGVTKNISPEQISEF